MSETGFHKEASQDSQEDTRKTKALRTWRWVVRAWAVLFIPVYYLLFMAGFSNFQTSTFAFLSIFVFITYPSTAKKSKRVAVNTRMIETVVSRAEDPASAFTEVVARLQKSSRVQDDEMQSILEHFAKRDDSIGQLARSMSVRDADR